jgi:hypothetical protein
MKLKHSLELTNQREIAAAYARDTQMTSAFEELVNTA